MLNRRALLAPLPLAALAGVLASCGSEETTDATPAADSTGGRGGAGAGGGGTGQNFTAVDLDTAGANASDANTDDVVAAVTAFLATLSAEEQDTVQYEFSDNLARVTWSNFPAAAVARNGIALGALSDAARTAALSVVQTLLSEQGYQQIEDILTADEWLAVNSSSGGSETFGSDNYYLAVFGTPSTTEAFQVQFGGHHIARNYTYLGTTASVTPHFTGTEPTSFTTDDGTTLAPMAGKADAFFAVFDSLSEDQVTQAQLAEDLEDLVMGPAQDSGVFPDSAGLLVSELGADQQTLVSAVLAAYVGDAADGLAASLTATYEASWAETYVAFSNTFDVDGENTYLRLDGPRVWIELINTRSQSTDGVHYHSVFRDKADDYGSTNPSA